MTRHGTRPQTALALCALGALTVGCASASTVREREVITPTSTVVTTASGSTISIGTQTQRVGRTTELEMTPDVAFSALPIAYRLLGIDVLTRQDRERIHGNTAIIARRRLGTERLSTYVDCGRGPTLANNADNYEVRMAVLSQVEPDEHGKTFITTRIDATARPLSTAGNRVDCASTGELERRIAEHVRNEATSR